MKREMKVTIPASRASCQLRIAVRDEDHCVRRITLIENTEKTEERQRTRWLNETRDSELL
jgi:hypothetical protein